MGSVIRRLSTRIEDGRIIHDDAPATFAEAESIVGRLGRRRSYAIIEGEVLVCARWTTACSGCTPGVEEVGCCMDRGGGCWECGYSGRRRRGEYLPLASLEEIE